ncbi:hypothetical protein ACIQCD_05390 [Streptomyces sp. NPDC093250]|uniref:hypothetical protein n=1 Tax=Streptomyces sp. NPDC093250 TaxID=3366036 RepID=UPI003813D813
MRLWDVRTGGLVCELEGNTTPEFSVALSADGCHAASCDNVGTVLFWDLDWEYTRPPRLTQLRPARGCVSSRPSAAA